MPAAKCCRSTPRCSDCPVRLRAIAQPRRGEGPAALVEEVLRGGRQRPLPASVTAALATLDAVGRRGPAPVAGLAG